MLTKQSQHDLACGILKVAEMHERSWDGEKHMLSILDAAEIYGGEKRYRSQTFGGVGPEYGPIGMLLQHCWHDAVLWARYVLYTSKQGGL